MIVEAKVFKSGNSQAIRIPKKVKINSNKIFLKKMNEGLLIIKPEKNFWENWWNSFDAINIKREQGSQENWVKKF